jgi:CheY-like chemotaxis protein
MPSGGVITISCENLPGEPGADSLGKCVRISIADQGEGIPCEILPRIFDPYFTTKSQGSGLGLASSYSIINKHGGRIEVDSIPGQGTTFHLYLPAVEDAAIQDRIEAVAPQARSCKILVMDDEDMLLAVASRMLGLLGHRAETARDGRDALELYQRARNTEQPFNGVILDLTIPGGMGGRETLSRLRELDPGVKAIVSSGYASGTVMSDFRSYGFSGVLSKPYSLKDLIRVLGEVFPKDGGDR